MNPKQKQDLLFLALFVTAVAACLWVAQGILHYP